MRSLHIFSGLLLVAVACQTLPVAPIDPADGLDAGQDSSTPTDSSMRVDARTTMDATAPADARDATTSGDASDGGLASDASDARDAAPPVCVPGAELDCYEGAAGTEGVGACTGGKKTCNALGTSYGACVGQILPAAAETCGNGIDETCDGTADEGCALPLTYAADVQPIFLAKCSRCHETFGSGGANFAVNYADTQLPSYYCAGKTKGACTLVRIQNGTMPAGRGCTGNPALDVGNASCLSAADQATIQQWITDGQLP
jgi:hypothetical protein